MTEQEHIDRLRKSRQLIGELTPKVIDFDGEILAGVRRDKAGWMRTYRVDTRKLAQKWETTVRIAKEMIRVNSNIQRTVSKQETQASLLIIAEELEKQGISAEKIASEVAKKVPFTDRYVRELLPGKYKMAQMAREPEIAELVPQKPEVEARVIKPEETWEQRKAVMAPPVSHMDEAVYLDLEQMGIPVEFQREFCVQSTTPDLYFPKHNAVGYLDGPVHEGREDRDEALRQLLSKRHNLKVISMPYERYSQSEKERVVQAILSELQGG